tara:strand:- start:7703 stop:8911 length:1209 start_codon:yes stop_codon:yes gene_type:complete
MKTMKNNETQTIEFIYDNNKDRCNCIEESNYGYKYIATSLDSDEVFTDLLSASQPKSIYNRSKKELICYGGKCTLLKRAIVIPNSYELFLAPWKADGLFSYPDAEIRKDWKTWFPTAHNASVDKVSGNIKNEINADRFSGTINLLDKSIKFIIKNHEDANNYWHWTFEWLPRLIILKDLAKKNKLFKNIILINIGDEMNSFQKEWIELILKGMGNIKYESYKSPILCENLLWITPPFPAHHDKDMITAIKNQMLSDQIEKTNNDCEYPKRIYLLRGEARNGRRIINENELIKKLSRLGFKAMKMDGLTVRKQAEIFSRADIIVGAHGSAFVNMVFCKQSCKILELFGPGYMSGHDYSLAYMNELQWKYMKGDAVDEKPNFLSDFYIDPEEIKKEIEGMIRGF